MILTVFSDLDTTEYLNAGIEDVGDDLGYLPLIDPLTSETQSDNIMSLRKFFNL